MVLYFLLIVLDVSFCLSSSFGTLCDTKIVFCGFTFLPRIPVRSSHLADLLGEEGVFPGRKKKKKKKVLGEE